METHRADSPEVDNDGRSSVRDDDASLLPQFTIASRGLALGGGCRAVADIKGTPGPGVGETIGG